MITRRRRRSGFVCSSSRSFPRSDCPLSGNSRAAALALFAVLAACEPPLEPIATPASRVLVHAVLDLGKSDQIVLVERTQPDANGFIGVGAATVTLAAPDGRVFTATQDPAGNEAAVYRFRELRQAGALIPGGTYVLSVASPAGDTVMGETTVPSTAPAPNPLFVGTFTKQTDTLRLDWPRIEGAR